MAIGLFRPRSLPSSLRVCLQLLITMTTMNCWQNGFGKMTTRYPSISASANHIPATWISRLWTWRGKKEGVCWLVDCLWKNAGGFKDGCWESFGKWERSAQVLHVRYSKAFSSMVTWVYSDLLGFYFYKKWIDLWSLIITLGTSKNYSGAQNWMLQLSKLKKDLLFLNSFRFVISLWWVQYSLYLSLNIFDPLLLFLSWSDHWKVVSGCNSRRVKT